MPSPLLFPAYNTALSTFPVTTTSSYCVSSSTVLCPASRRVFHPCSLRHISQRCFITLPSYARFCTRIGCPLPLSTFALTSHRCVLRDGVQVLTLSLAPPASRLLHYCSMAKYIHRCPAYWNATLLPPSFLFSTVPSMCC